MYNIGNKLIFGTIALDNDNNTRIFCDACIFIMYSTGNNIYLIECLMNLRGYFTSFELLNFHKHNFRPSLFHIL